MRVLFFIFLFSISVQTIAAPQTIIPPIILSSKKILQYSSTHASKTVINKEELTANGATSLSQALQELGSIQVQDASSNGSQAALSMRGFGANASSNTLLLINGIPITNPDMQPPDLNTIPLQEIEFIEIINGSESVLYGDQAVGGTINIVTRKHTKEKITVECMGGSYNMHRCAATLGNNNKQLAYGINIFNTHTDNYRAHNNYDQNHLAGRVDYSHPTGSLAFNYEIASENMQYPGALTAAEVQQNRRQANNNTDYFRNWNGFYHFQDQQKITTNWQLETDLARREMHGNGVLTLPFSQSRIIHFIKPQIKGTIGKGLLTSGIDFENDNYHLKSLLGLTNDSEKKYSIFSIYNYQLTSRLSFSLGARGAQQSNHLQSYQTSYRLNRAFAGTLGSSFELNPTTKIYLRRAENYRFPKADENAMVPMGVTALRTQRGVSYETGVDINLLKAESKVGIYQLNLRDEITFDPTQTPLQPFGANRNLAPTVRRGGFLTEKIMLTDKLTFGGQYNYVNARFQEGPNNGNRIPLVAENIIHASINYQCAPHWNFFSEAILTGNQYAANDDANKAGKVGAYTLYNFNLRYQLKQFSAAFRVNNLFNKYYYVYTVFQPSMDQEFFYPAPGRNFSLTLNYVFL